MAHGSIDSSRSSSTTSGSLGYGRGGAGRGDGDEKGGGGGAGPGRSKRRRDKWYSKLVLLLWKNLLLRKRHWLLSLFELLLPTLLFALLVIIRVLPDSVFLPVVIDQTTVFKPADETALRYSFCNDTAGLFNPNKNECTYFTVPGFGDRKFLYGPTTPFTDDLMERVRADLGLRKDELLSVSSNEEMNDLVGSLYLQSNGTVATYYAGVFFHLDDDAPESGDDIPDHLEYDLRLQKFWFTELVFPFLQIPGPRNFTGELPNLGKYASGGFSLLQTLVDRHYTAMVTGEEDYAATVELETQMYPYPPYVQDRAMNQFFGSSLPTFVVLSLVLLSPTLIKSIVHEKETGVRELVRLMGLEGWLVWLGWFLHSFIMIVLISAVMTFFLKLEVYTPKVDGVLPALLPNSDGFLMWVLLLLYGVSSIAFCFAISCFFSKPTLATTMGILIWLLSYFIPRGIMEPTYDDMGLAPKIISCLLPNMAITWGFRIIGMFEGRAVGIRWDNLWDTGNPRDELSPAMVLIMLTVDILLYFLITWYFDQVLPGKYGVPRSWLFPFQSTYWKKAEARPRTPIDGWGRQDASNSGDQQQNFEREPTGHKPGIVIKNLRKEFPALGGGVKVAVEDVSLTCYEGQCTVLLGHNGAGKTTTMSVITGVYTASGGTAEIQGYDINSNLKEAREQVGLCPQHNTLFADLSVMEHLLFFAQLKGLTRSEARKEADELLARMQLTSKETQFGNQLSGGMKRKLCLCIALIGGSQVVILDEPSSGLDPESRRWVWDMVQQERGQRTVLVTTHHMEEADVLGDRIAIMASGRVVCAGSTLFLKRRFGDGYSLRVLPQKGCQVAVVTSTVQGILPGSALSSTTQEELIYRLAADTQHFPRLLQALSDNKQKLKISHVGLSLTSMEQVFLRVGESLHLAAEGGEKSSNGILKTTGGARPASDDIPLEDNFMAGGVHGQTPLSAYDDRRYLFNSQSNIETRLSGGSLFFERLKSLWLKKFIYTKRKWVLLLTQGLVPVLVTIMCLLVDAAFFGSSTTEGPRLLDIKMFDWSQSYVQGDQGLDAYTACYQDQFNEPYEVELTDNVTASLANAGVEDEFHYRENDVTSAWFQNGEDGTLVTRMLYQSIPYHAAGVGVNMLSNALLQCALNGSDGGGQPQQYSISTSNYPLPVDKRYRLESDSTTGSALVYSMMMPVALAFLSASFLVFPLQERECKAKQIQVMTGTPAWMLWLTTFSWDLLSYTASAVLVLACFLGFNSQGFFTLPGAPGALCLLLMLYGWSALPIAYLFSFPFTTAASGFAILALFNIVTGMVISIATWALSASESESLLVLSAVLGNVSSFIPAYPASKGFKNLVDMGTYNTQCDIVEPALVETLCEALYLQYDRDNSTMSLFMPCCKQCADVPEIPCFTQLSYLQWTSPGMGEQLTWMAADGLLFLLLLLLIEAGVVDILRNGYYKARQWLIRSKPTQGYIVPADDDVLEETALAQELMAEGEPDAALVVAGLTKTFLGVGLTAVNNVNFHVARGECFGLLGVNGAGKTTTFRMLTGDERPSGGDARIGSTFLSQGKTKFVQEIGYCPQFDAILDELTGEEMLTLLAGLRGVPSSRRRLMVQEFVELVDLTECHKRQTSTYSGGNKRKLSTAMALVGNPPLVFLDEPTTGVDPASRRRVWTAIRTARSKGQSIILTSHSMDECEALCSRLVILVRGQLRCAGTPAHLKAKYSQGYSLQVKLRAGSDDGSTTEHMFKQGLAKLQHTIHSRLPGSRLTDQHRGMLAYLVPPSLGWADVFAVMEDLKEGGGLTNGAEVSLVEDYAATDPSLEQVFLAFAREADEATVILQKGTQAPELVTHL